MKLSIEHLMVGDYVYYDGNVFIEDEYEQPAELVIAKILNGNPIGDMNGDEFIFSTESDEYFEVK